MSAVEFMHFFAELAVAFILIRFAEMFGPKPVANTLGAVFHA